MNKGFLFFISFLFFLSCQRQELFFKGSYVIHKITIVDPLEGLIPNQTVVIKGDQIFEIYNSKDLLLSSKNKIYDAGNSFLIPGLWDAHIHFGYEKELASYMPDLFLYHGVTSLRDTGGPFDFVNKFKQEALKCPQTRSRIKIAGPLLDGTFNVYDGSDASHPSISIQNVDTTELKKNIEFLVEQKVDFLKAYEMLSPEQFKTLIDLSKKYQLKVTGHIPLSMDVISASNYGLNSVEHFRNIELSMTSLSEELLLERKHLLQNESLISGANLRSQVHNKQRMRSIYSLDSSKLKQVVSVLAKNDTWQIPTLTLYNNFAEKKYLSDEYAAMLELLPEDIKKLWKSRIEKSNSDLSDELKDYTKWSKSMVDFMHKQGITFMAGTDTPIGFLIPGLSLHQEIEALHNSGLSALEALQTATVNPARYFNLQDSLGRIKKNYIADLVILEANPLSDIRNTKKIKAVIKAGNYLDRNYLDSLVK
jgi:imidazolonepropionase-like amidohydrolase